MLTEKTPPNDNTSNMHMIKGIVCQFCLAAKLATLGNYWIHKSIFLTMSVKVHTFA